MKRELSMSVFSFSDGSSVQWRYLGMFERLYKKEKRYAIQVRVETTPCIDQFFESWDKPSIACAEHFVKNAIKDAKQVK